MCQDGHDRHGVDFEQLDPAADPVLSGHRWRPSRRTMLAGAAGGAVGLFGSRFLATSPAAAAGAASPFTAQPALRTAMHVHGSWSEGYGSWESQFAQAAALGLDVIYMTDHDFRGEAYGYLTSLSGIKLAATHAGSLAQGSFKNTKGTVRVVAESSGSASASYGATVASNTASNRLRTSIAGHTMALTFAAARIDEGGMYEVVATLSNHPAYGGHVAGQYELHYRFGAFAPGRSVDPNGYVGVVTAPSPGAGAQVTLDLVRDVSALWPDLLAFDNALYALELRATSPGRGKVVDVSAALHVSRTQNDPASLTSLQQQVIQAYSPRYPTLTGYATSEISLKEPHIIPFGVPQMWPKQSTITPDVDAAYSALVAGVHQQGGLVSWNHPFGTANGPLLSAALMASTRRSVFASMTADGRDGTDLLEVGYTVRGHVNTQTHLDLWDTFSRHAVFITGNGVNDDHQGLQWPQLTNGFATGIWGTSPAQADLVAALAGGRAFTYHVGSWAGAQLDTLVDDTVGMGQVSVSSATSRQLDVFAGQLPTGAVVEVVTGPVDYSSDDPGTAVITRLNAAGFAGSGVQSVAVDTSESCFVRTQVRTTTGAIVGVGNPTWLLQAPPAAGIPAARGGG
jgi:hypothetical protein